MNAKTPIGQQVVAQLAEIKETPILQQVAAKLHEDQMRVTSIPYRSKNMVIFSGVPLAKNSYKTNSGKYYVTIKADPDSIPVQPAVGQHWSVKGARLIEEMETGDYVMQQHTYESPTVSNAACPKRVNSLFALLPEKATLRELGKAKPGRSGSFWVRTFTLPYEKIHLNQENV